MPRQGQTKAERRQARSIGSRLSHLEEAVAGLSQQGEELLSRAAQAQKAMQTAERSRAELEGPLDAATAEGLQQALRLRRENVVPVSEPLALICQAQRSGGTLLARLFDGHPQCHAHPHELHIGARRPHTWPDLPLDEDPEAWFAKLKEERLGLMFSKGRRRVPLKAQIEKANEFLYPFMLPPAFQRILFLDEVGRRQPIESEREILDCYMTSLFNAWLDNESLRGPDKRWVVAFSPRRAWGDGLERFFGLYPDGRLISILRDPFSWFASAQGRDPNADPAVLLDLWKRSAREMLEASRRYAERVTVVRFEELVLETEAAMRHLAAFLEIDFDPRLVAPTFNGYPVGPNSSYEDDRTGVVTEPVDRYKELLSDEQQEHIRGECEGLYQETLALTKR
jgi:hypothetical protein